MAQHPPAWLSPSSESQESNTQACACSSRWVLVGGSHRGYGSSVQVRQAGWAASSAPEPERRVPELDGPTEPVDGVLEDGVFGSRAPHHMCGRVKRAQCPGRRNGGLN